MAEEPSVHIHRDNLDLETLAKFKVPWEVDQANPDYIILKGDLANDHLTMLLEHSIHLRELRQRKPALFVDCEHQYFTGPNDRKAPYTSFCVLDPVITVERHGEDVHIAARFNIETTILRYHSRKSDHHETFFHGICLQYLRDSAKEVLVTSPESDPSAAFTVTRSTNTTVSGQAGMTLSEIPSANVSLGLSRSTGLTVQYAVGSWSVSAHRVVDDALHELERPRYQWFWAGTQEDTKKLTADLKHTVKRHVVVKRIVPARGFPFNSTENEMDGKEGTPNLIGTVASGRARTQANGEAERAGNEKGKGREPKAASQVPGSVEEETLRSLPPERLLQALERCFTFSFCMKIRVKRRYGRFHRLLLLSTNEVKSGLLKPAYEQKFNIQPDSKWLRELLEEGTRAKGDTDKEEKDKGEKGKGHKDEGHKDEGEKNEEEKNEEEKNEEEKNEEEKNEEGKNEEGKDEGETDEEHKDEEHKDEEHKDEEHKDEEHKDEEHKDEEHKDEEHKDEEHKADGGKADGEKGDKKEKGNGAGGSFELPLGETIDITEELEKMKEQNNGNWDKLQGKPLADLLGRRSFKTLEDWRKQRRDIEMREQRMKMEMQRVVRERMERMERERREREMERMMHERVERMDRQMRLSERLAPVHQQRFTRTMD